MHPKRRSIRLLVIFAISSAALLLFSSLRLSSPPPTTSFPNPNPNPTTLRFVFAVKLLTYDRIASLQRCLRSLAAADYSGDRADLHVFVDHFRAANDSAFVDRKLEESRRILEFVDGFEWRHGEKRVHYRTGNAGLQAQWLEAWWPGSDDEFAFVVEDDLEVSPLYYRFLKGLILRYYYDSESYNPSIYGASLQRPRFVAGKHGNKLQVDSETRLFLYQMVGTWGQLLFPKPWKEFRLWYDIQKAKGIKPILQGMVTTGWYKKMGDRIWTPWFIKFIHSRGYYNIYTNFLHERALSVSHRDAGVNYGKSAGPDSSLLQESSLGFNLWDMQPLRNLKWYDFCFREVHPGRVMRSFDELGSVLDSLQKHKTISFVSLYQTNEKIARNLFCHLEKLDMQNSILVGDNLEFLLDAARRGYPVIDANQLVNSIGGLTLTNKKPSEREVIEEIMVKANVVKKAVESGYDLWLIDGNLIPITDSFSQLQDPSCDITAAKDVELMFVKNSSSSSGIWDEKIISKVAELAHSLMSSNSVPVGQRHFTYFLLTALDGQAGVGVRRLDEDKHGMKYGTDTAGNVSTETETGKKLAFWAPDQNVDLIQRWLQSMNLWLIDEDLACTAVICHGR